jgi:hypothetical protein
MLFNYKKKGVAEDIQAKSETVDVDQAADP